MRILETYCYTLTVHVVRSTRGISIHAGHDEDPTGSVRLTDFKTKEEAFDWLDNRRLKRRWPFEEERPVEEQPVVSLADYVRLAYDYNRSST